MKFPAVLSAPWAIQPAALEELMGRYNRADLAGTSAVSPGAVRAKTRGEFSLQGATAVIAIEGVLMKRPGFFDMLFGAESTEDLKLDIEAALADPAVKGIVLDVNSPGGGVDGTQELAQAVYDANAKKPVAALANGLMASAAYWIGAAADSVHVSSDTAMVGSIGVVATHMDISKAHERMGIKTTEIFAGRYKTHGSSHAPLTDEGRATIQSQVDYMYTVFVNDVARLRGVPAGTVQERMADGRVFLGQQAIQAGLADGLATLSQLVGSMNAGALPRQRRSSAGAAMAAVVPLPQRRETLEDRCKREWRKNADLRGHFGNCYEAYVADQRLIAEGRVDYGREPNG